MLVRSLYSRLGQRGLAAARLFSDEAYVPRAIPKPLAQQSRPTSPILFLYGLPTTRGGSESYQSTHELAKIMYQTASEAAPVSQVLMAPQGKNFGWIEFNTAKDATAFKSKFTDSDPLLIKSHPVRIEYGERKPCLGGVTDGTEVAIRYNTTGISSDEAVKLAKEKYPEATVTTNVKSNRGLLGTIFVQFKSTEEAQEAFRAYQKSPIQLGEIIGESVMPSPPNSELTIYNLKPFIPIQDIINPLSEFGNILKHRHAFQKFGPNVTGRARVAFSEVSQAQALLEATMNEEVVIHDFPLRAEYFTMRYNPNPIPEGAPQGSSAY